MPQKCLSFSMPGKIPSVLFNATFGFKSGSWAADACPSVLRRGRLLPQLQANHRSQQEPEPTRPDLPDGVISFVVSPELRGLDRGLLGRGTELHEAAGERGVAEDDPAEDPRASGAGVRGVRDEQVGSGGARPEFGLGSEPEVRLLLPLELTWRLGSEPESLAAVKVNRVRAFRDDDALNRGDEIALSLLEAIEDSTAAIVILSPRYAESKWCLEESATELLCRP